MTSPPVQIAHAGATPASTAAVKRLHDLADGTLVVYPTPGTGGQGIARDILHALGKRFGARAPRDPRKLEALAALWMLAERISDLVVAGAERRPVSEWKLLRDLCRQERSPVLTFVVERAVHDPCRAALGTDVIELTLDELATRIPRGRGPLTLACEIGALVRTLSPGAK